MAREASLGLGDLPRCPGEQAEDHEVCVLQPIDCLTEGIGRTHEDSRSLPLGVLLDDVAAVLGRVSPMTRED